MIDQYRYWTLALSWTERRKPYDPNVSRAAADYRPELVYGKVLRYDSEDQAWEAKRRLEIDRTWVPAGASDAYVSGPSFVKRDKPLEMQHRGVAS